MPITEDFRLRPKSQHSSFQVHAILHFYEPQPEFSTSLTTVAQVVDVKPV